MIFGANNYIVVLFSIFLAGCNKSNQDIFQESFGIPRPAFLETGEQEISSPPYQSIFYYHGKFVGNLENFNELCKLLNLSQAEHYCTMPPLPSGGNWWDAPSLVEQLKDFKSTYYRGYTDKDKIEDVQLGVIARTKNGNIYLTKVGSNRYGTTTRHFIDGK